MLHVELYLGHCKYNSLSVALHFSSALILDGNYLSLITLPRQASFEVRFSSVSFTSPTNLDLYYSLLCDPHENKHDSKNNLGCNPHLIGNY